MNDLSGGLRAVSSPGLLPCGLLLACVAASSTGCGFAAEPEAASGKMSGEAIVRELRDYSLEGINRRLGPDYNFYHPTGPTEPFPNIYLVPPKRVPPEAGPPGNGPGAGPGNTREYQWGGPWRPESGDYSSTQGQVIYVPDRKLQVDPKTKIPNDGMGVDRVTIIEMSHHCFTEKPEPPWWGGFRPEPTAKTWVEKAGETIGVPFAAVRAQGTWSNSGILLFSSGFMAPAGTVTARGTDPSFKFPANKLPTAVSITSKNEFALVTVIDTDKMTGQVAVFALTGGGKKAPMPHDWVDDYPGLPNVAVFSAMKFLGYVDLPGMNFPTGVSAASTGYSGRLNGRNGHAGMLSEFNLSNPADREIFNKGDNSGYTATAGHAVVISKYEGKVAFLDLQALFERVRAAYFTSEESFQETRKMGDGPREWPYTFEGEPQWKPTLVKVMDIAQPTAVLTHFHPGASAFVASLDGTLTAFSLGGLSTTARADANAIAAGVTMKVGRNPTAMAYAKHTADSFLVVSRGDREISWVNWGEKPTVTRRLRDARLIDPVHAEVSDTHGIEAPIVTVVDFRGRKIANYRYGVLNFATQGGEKFGVGATGKDEFECGGMLEFPGHPFVVSATNVN